MSLFFCCHFAAYFCLLLPFCSFLLLTHKIQSFDTKIVFVKSWRPGFCSVCACVLSKVIEGIFLPNFQSDRYHILQLHQPQGPINLTLQTTPHFEVNSRKQHAKHAADHSLLPNLLKLTYIVLHAGLNVHLGAFSVQP